MAKYLIFGGSGSLGVTLLRRLTINVGTEIIVFSRDESKHWALKNQFMGKNISFMVGDIRDKDRVKEAIARTKPNIIIIASALKHVDVCELAPAESIKTNIQGPQNVADVVEENYDLFRTHLNTVLMVSTDKACSPINVYGMSKAIAERVVLEKARLRTGINFIAVRYGNVLESRGSIIPLFMHQAQNGTELTVTREDMTRFVMSLDQSVDLILDCIAHASTGQTFVPKLRSMRIIELAQIFSEKYGTPIKITGIRSGEKIHESMINETESLRTVEKHGRFVIMPAYDGTVYNEKVFDFNSSTGVMTKQELEKFLIEKGYLDRNMADFNDSTVDTVRKVSQEDIRKMTN